MLRPKANQTTRSQRFNMLPYLPKAVSCKRTRDARKVMVLDLGFLGDTIHLLPALWMIRQAYPQAELHAAVADHIISLMDLPAVG